MIKNTVIALVAAATLAGAAAPAFAEGFDSDLAVARLQDQGVNASDAEEWGDLVRAYVTNADGQTVMQFFTADTLTPVAR